MIRLYAIVKADGTIKKGSAGQYAFYNQYARACFWAKDEGDSVVVVDIDLNKEPLYIRGKVL
jgi:hypothetical protein